MGAIAFCTRASCQLSSFFFLWFCNEKVYPFKLPRQWAPNLDTVVVGWTLKLFPLITKIACFKVLLDWREGWFPVDHTRPIPLCPEPKLRFWGVDWRTVVALQFSMFGSTVHCCFFTVPNLYKMFWLFWFIMRNQAWTEISPANIGLLNAMPLVACTTHHRLSWNWIVLAIGWPNWPQTTRHWEKRRKWAAIVWAMGELFEWIFKTTNTFPFRGNQCPGTDTCFRWLSAKVSWQWLL